jgi:hypothetical protein
MSDRLISWVRTILPALWSTLIAYLVSLGLPSSVVTAADGLGQTVLVPLVLAGVYAAIRWAEPRLPIWLRTVLTGSAQQPTYPPAGE